jgi:hypothetical protein
MSIFLVEIGTNNNNDDNIESVSIVVDWQGALEGKTPRKRGVFVVFPKAFHRFYTRFGVVLENGRQLRQHNIKELRVPSALGARGEARSWKFRVGVRQVGENFLERDYANPRFWFPSPSVPLPQENSGTVCDSGPEPLLQVRVGGRIVLSG